MRRGKATKPARPPNYLQDNHFFIYLAFACSRRVQYVIDISCVGPLINEKWAVLNQSTKARKGCVFRKSSVFASNRIVISWAEKDLDKPFVFASHSPPRANRHRHRGRVAIIPLKEFLELTFRTIEEYPKLVILNSPSPCSFIEAINCFHSWFAGGHATIPRQMYKCGLVCARLEGVPYNLILTQQKAPRKRGARCRQTTAERLTCSR